MTGHDVNKLSFLIHARVTYSQKPSNLRTLFRMHLYNWTLFSSQCIKTSWFTWIICIALGKNLITLTLSLHEKNRKTEILSNSLSFILHVWLWYHYWSRWIENSNFEIVTSAECCDLWTKCLKDVEKSSKTKDLKDVPLKYVKR